MKNFLLGLFGFLGFLGFLGLFSGSASAQDITTDACLTEMYSAMLKEQLFFRSVLFGQKDAAALPHNAVRYDASLNAWIKTGDNTWKSYAKGFEGTTWSNTLMNEQGYPPKRTGMVETERVLASEWLPPRLQATRAFRCRLRAVCLAAVQSRASSAAETLSVQPDGCISVNMKRFNACRDTQTVNQSTVDVGAANVQIGVCDQAVDEILEREANMMTLVVSYDAGYRSFLQFAGIVQGFSDALRTPVLGTLTNVVRSMQHIGSASCFNAQCDE